MSPTDEARFLAFLKEHRGILYKVAFGYCRDREDRGDLVQEMVIQLWRSFERYDGSVKFSTWAYRVAMNVASRTSAAKLGACATRCRSTSWRTSSPPSIR